MRAALLVLLLCGFSFTAAAADYQTATVTEGLRQPWSLEVLPDGSFLVAEKKGNIVWVKADGAKQTVGTIEDSVVRGQGGLMDLALHPKFSSNSYVYYSYTGKQGRKYDTRIGRFVWRDGKVTNQEELFRTDTLSSNSRHFGSRIVFDDEGFMFIGIGDRGDPDEAQNLKNHYGKILRLTDAGKLASGNPFKQNAAVYSMGHRNPQGLVFAEGKLWSHEHGASGGDELNIIRAGRNYGWPVISYGTHYTGLKIGEGTKKAGMEQPLAYWDPSIAPSGMIKYQGSKFPQWRGDIFLGALRETHLRRVDMRGEKAGEQEVMLDGLGRVRDVAQDPAGFIYVVFDSASSPLLRLEPVN